MKILQTLLLVLLHHLSLVVAIPLIGSSPHYVVHSTVRADGAIVDWIPLDSQVENETIASPPPPPSVRTHAKTAFTATNRTSFSPKPNSAGTDKGPEGTVPIVRNSGFLAKKRPPPNMHSLKQNVQRERRAYGDHWYAAAEQLVRNVGGSAIFSLYEAWCQGYDDFSLLQTAVLRRNVQIFDPCCGDPNVRGLQSIEAGWTSAPNQPATPYFFIAYTTNDYRFNGDYQGGNNRDVLGWIQVDGEIYPGVTFRPLSTPNGDQYDVQIYWLLFERNWWLFVLDRWVGYYPANLFGRGYDPNNSLMVGSTSVAFYGEIWDTHDQITSTDMGSGYWPEAGWGQSAYIRNMLWMESTEMQHDFDGSREVYISDPDRYRLVADWKSQSEWGSYMYVGGPGAGGQIGA